MFDGKTVLNMIVNRTILFFLPNTALLNVLNSSNARDKRSKYATCCLSDEIQAFSRISRREQYLLPNTMNSLEYKMN